MNKIVIQNFKSRFYVVFLCFCLLLLTLGATHANTVDLIRQINQSYNLPDQLVIGVARVESGLNPHVRNGRAGEIGLYQIKPATARGIGCGNIYTTHGNIHCGLKHLAIAYRKCGTIAGAASLHNAGIYSRCRVTAYSRKVISAALTPTKIKHSKMRKNGGTQIKPPHHDVMEFLINKSNGGL